MKYILLIIEFLCLVTYITAQETIEMPDYYDEEGVILTPDQVSYDFSDRVDSLFFLTFEQVELAERLLSQFDQDNCKAKRKAYRQYFGFYRNATSYAVINLIDVSGKKKEYNSIVNNLDKEYLIVLTEPGDELHITYLVDLENELIGFWD